MTARLWRPLFLMLAFLIPAFAAAQGPGAMKPTKEPSYNGTRAVADLPTSQHKRNVGGSDGAGLCVYTSFWHAAIWQDERAVMEFREWMRRRPGGSYPEKFDATLKAFCREKGHALPDYIQHTGGDVEFLELALRTGRMPCVTYCGVDGEGRYGGSVIAHMVNLVHLDEKTACVLDNNFPGSFLWMTRAEFVSRWRGVQSDGRPFTIRSGLRSIPVGGGWAIVLLAPPPAPYPESPPVSYGAAPCACEGECKCAEQGKTCPGGCAVAPVQFGQCPGGNCPIRPQTFPALPNPFGPIYPPAGPQAVPAPMPPGPKPVGPPPSPDFEWAYLPHCGWGWVQRSIVPKAAPAKPIEAEPPPVLFAQDADPCPGGVDPEKLFNGAPQFWINGERSDKKQVKAALETTLADDSTRWNLAAVGPPDFLARVKEDVAKLTADVRGKLHLQTYPADAWQAQQFRLAAGVTLRKPAVGRVGADAGFAPAAEYSAAKLADVLGVVSGKQPAPPPHEPKTPDEPAKPEPKTPDEPAKPGPQPAPAVPGNTLLAILAAVIAIVLGVFRR